jgi:hypothetical protein
MWCLSKWETPGSGTIKKVCDKAKKHVSLWNNQNEQSFNSVEELIGNATIESSSFLLLWEKATIQTLF